jgi:hypothetical protein
MFGSFKMWLSKIEKVIFPHQIQKKFEKLTKNALRSRYITGQNSRILVSGGCDLKDGNFV